MPLDTASTPVENQQSMAPKQPDLPNFGEFAFPSGPFDALLGGLGYQSRAEWVEHWLERGGSRLAVEAWEHPPSPDWIWGIALPLLTQIENESRQQGRRIIGISAFPGTGKTTLCRWLMSASAALGIETDSCSIDDFYYGHEDLERSACGNPWGVSRGFPGTHDMNALQTFLQTWLAGSEAQAPVFDKSLRDGAGDRSGFRPVSASVLLFEGWFVGVPAHGSKGQMACREQDPIASHATVEEKNFQTAVLASLAGYQNVWEALDVLWRIRPDHMDAIASWKRQQKSFKASEDVLQRYMRMMHCSISAECWDLLQPDVEAVIGPSRQVHRVGSPQAASPR